MAPASSNCIACGKAFAENRELAAIPDASKIAFDPGHRRVWRICASCGEWNLLGSEAAAAALPELEARFAAVMPSGAPELAFAPARVSGRLELLRVGRAELLGRDDSSSVRLRTEVDQRAKRMRWVYAVVGAGIALWWGFIIVLAHGDPEVPILLLLTYSETGLLFRIAAKLRGDRTSLWGFVANAALMLAAAGLLVAYMPLVHLKYNLGGLVLALPVIVLLELSRGRIPVVRIRLLDGSKLRVSGRAIRRVRLSWTTDDLDVMLHDLPGDRSLAMADVAPVFRKLYPWALPKRGVVQTLATMTTLTENAYNLLSTLGGLRGLLRALEGFQRDNDGRVLIADLPALYLVALDLALTAEAKSGGSDDALHDKAREAAAIAHEAEGLERE
jgi:hypothetical protein